MPFFSKSLQLRNFRKHRLKVLWNTNILWPHVLLIILIAVFCRELMGFPWFLDAQCTSTYFKVQMKIKFLVGKAWGILFKCFTNMWKLKSATQLPFSLLHLKSYELSFQRRIAIITNFWVYLLTYVNVAKLLTYLFTYYCTY